MTNGADGDRGAKLRDASSWSRRTVRQRETHEGHRRQKPGRERVQDVEEELETDQTADSTLTTHRSCCEGPALLCPPSTCTGNVLRAPRHIYTMSSPWKNYHKVPGTQSSRTRRYQHLNWTTAWLHHQEGPHVDDPVAMETAKTEEPPGQVKGHALPSRW